jgi:hypothetical protein
LGVSISFPFVFCLSFLVPPFYFGFLVSSSFYVFVEMTSIIAEFFHCCWSCDRNSVWWFQIFQIFSQKNSIVEVGSGFVFFGCQVVKNCQKRKRRD